LLALLGGAAGAAKVARVPQEVAFFESMGLGVWFVIAFGALQLAGAIALVVPRVRRAGAMLSAAMFLASAIMLFVSGAIPFGLISLLPVALLLWLFSRFSRNQARVPR